MRAVRFSLLLLTFLCFPAAGASGADPVAPRAEAICPALPGSAIPASPLLTADGQGTTLPLALGGEPAILIFYRGGWCPFCSAHLGEISGIADSLRALGYRIVAVSPDRPERLRATATEEDLGYRLYSDPKLAAARALGLAFQVDDEYLERLRGYGIDLEAASGETHHQLPVPAAFVVDAQGVIRFSYVNPDYRERVDAQVLLAAARAARKEE